MIRRYGCLFSVVGTPVVAVLGALSYARAKTSTAARIGTFVLLLPVIVLVTVVWFLAWSFLVWYVLGLFAR